MPEHVYAGRSSVYPLRDENCSVFTKALQILLCSCQHLYQCGGYYFDHIVQHLNPLRNSSVTTIYNISYLKSQCFRRGEFLSSPGNPRNTRTDSLCDRPCPFCLFGTNILFVTPTCPSLATSIQYIYCHNPSCVCHGYGSLCPRWVSVKITVIVFNPAAETAYECNAMSNCFLLFSHQFSVADECQIFFCYYTLVFQQHLF